MAAAKKSKPDGSKNNPFLMKKGLTFSLNVTVKVDGRFANLAVPVRTGRSQMRRTGDEHNPSAVAAATLTVTITDAARGLAVISLGATITAALDAGDYLADVEFEDTGTPNPDDVIGSNLFYIRVGEEASK